MNPLPRPFSLPYRSSTILKQITSGAVCSERMTTSQGKYVHTKSASVNYKNRKKKHTAAYKSNIEDLLTCRYAIWLKLGSN